MQKKPNTKKKYKFTGNRARAFPKLQIVNLKRRCREIFVTGTSVYIESSKNLSQIGDAITEDVNLEHRVVLLGDARMDNAGHAVGRNGASLIFQRARIGPGGYRYLRS